MHTALQANKMVIISGSVAMPNGLTFIVGQITWTTGSDDFIAMTTEEARIQSASTTASSASATALTMVDGSGHASIVFSHADNPSSASLLQREAD